MDATRELIIALASLAADSVIRGALRAAVRWVICLSVSLPTTAFLPASLVHLPLESEGAVVVGQVAHHADVIAFRWGGVLEIVS